MKDKLRFIFIPTLACLFGLTVVYTFLHWLLIIKLEIFPESDFFVEFMIPMALSALLVLLIIRPRCKILDLEVKNGNWSGFYSFFIFIALIVPTIITQDYIVTASGTLTKLSSANEIDPTALTKYYILEHYYIDKRLISSDVSMDVSGKRKENFNMYLYVTTPLLASEADTSTLQCPAWLGKEYKKTINNNLAPEVKEARFREFVNSSEYKFKSEAMAEFQYLDRVGYSSGLDGLMNAAKGNTFVGPPIVLTPVNEPFEERNGSKLAWIAITSLAGLTIWSIMIFPAKIDEDQLMRVKQRKPNGLKKQIKVATPEELTNQ